MRRSVLPFAIVALAACGLPEGARTENDAKPLQIHNVEWNPTHVDVGKALAVADVDGDVVVAGEAGATILEAGAPLNVDAHAGALRSLAIIPAPDGTGRWIAGVNADGNLVRLRAKKTFEPVAERYGLTTHKVSGVAGSGDHLVAFDLEGELAVADGKDVKRFTAPPLKSLFAGGDAIAGLTSSGVWLFDPATKSPRTFSLPGARFVAVDEHGHLYAATDEAVYADRGDGTLALRFRSSNDAIHGLVASGDRVWFADGGELGVVEGGTTRDVKLTRGARVPAASRLASSPSGDVWTIDAAGVLARWSVGDAKTGTQVAWESSAGPVFARVCSSCHSKGGTSGIDLSTEASWRAHASSVRQRVLVARDMPPKGQLLSDADRLAIQEFMDSTTATIQPPRHD